MKYLSICLMSVILLLAACTQPPEDVPAATIEEPTQENNEVEEAQIPELEGDVKPIDASVSTFTFEGYGPGKSHDGTFDFYEGNLAFDGDEIVGAAGTIDATSVNTGISGLDSHLKKDDFFDVAVYPTMSFSSNNIEDGTMTGSLTFRGVTKDISFPVEVTETSLSADFLLDVTPYGMTYTGINEEVRIMFDMQVQDE